MPLLLTLNIGDADGQQAAASFHIESNGAFTLDQIDGQIEMVWDAVRPLINGVLLSAQVTYRPSISAFTNNTPTAISDVEEKALLTLRVCQTNELIRVSLPTVKETIFAGSGAQSELDVTNADVAVFYLLVTEGFGDDNGGFVNNRNQDVCDVAKGVQRFGKG